jgi:hypothetical protein
LVPKIKGIAAAPEHLHAEHVEIWVDYFHPERRGAAEPNKECDSNKDAYSSAEKRPHFNAGPANVHDAKGRFFKFFRHERRAPAGP